MVFFLNPVFKFMQLLFGECSATDAETDCESNGHCAQDEQEGEVDDALCKIQLIECHEYCHDDDQIFGDFTDECISCTFSDDSGQKIAPDKAECQDNECRDHQWNIGDDCRSDCIEYFKVKYTQCLYYEEQSDQHCNNPSKSIWYVDALFGFVPEIHIGIEFTCVQALEQIRYQFAQDLSQVQPEQNQHGCSKESRDEVQHCSHHFPDGIRNGLHFQRIKYRRKEQDEY